MDIGTALRHLRDDLGLTQKQMIQGTKITVSHYSKLEKGQNRIFIENLVEILKQRNISLSYFVDHYLNDENSEKEVNYSEILNIAFYEKDKIAAEEIKRQIFSDKSSSNELRDRATLIVDMIDNQGQSNVDARIINSIFKHDNWTQYDEAIILLGNIIRTSNVLNMSPLVLTLIRKYKDLDKEKIEKQRRLATVGINYLFNFRKLSKEFNKNVLKIISWIKTTSIVPELGIIRELNAYFLAVYEGNISVSTNIKNVLKISGYQNLANDLPN